MAEQKKHTHLFALSLYKAAFIEVISSNTLQTHVCMDTCCGRAFSFLSVTASMTVREARVYFLLIQFFLQCDSKVYRAKTSAFVFHVLLPWQHQLQYGSVGSPVKYGCGSEFTIFQTQDPISATSKFNGKCVRCIRCKICFICVKSRWV